VRASIEARARSAARRVNLVARKSRWTANLTEALLRDREERRARAREAAKQRSPRATGAEKFDPFSVTRWKIIAPVNGGPGYLVATPMRRGSAGWWIACGSCGCEFESKGWRYCSKQCRRRARDREANACDLAGVGAEIDKSWRRMCQGDGCWNHIPVWTATGKRVRSDAKFCSRKCANASNYRGGQDSAAEVHFDRIKPSSPDSFFGPTDFPITVIGLGRRGRTLLPDLMGAVLEVEGERLESESLPEVAGNFTITFRAGANLTAAEIDTLELPDFLRREPFRP
jgi:hypothetical protein